MFFFHSFCLQLKVQEAMRKKEKFQREHEEVSTTKKGAFFSIFNIDTLWTR